MSDINKSLFSKIFGDVLSKPQLAVEPLPPPKLSGGTSSNSAVAENTVAQAVQTVETVQAGGARPHAPFVQFGGKKKVGGAIKELTDGSPLFKRLIIILFILFCAIYFTAVSFQSEKLIYGVFKLPGQEENDINFDDPNVNFMQRWRKIIQMIVVFIFLVIAYTLAIFATIYICLTIYFGIEGKYDDVNKVVLELMREWFLVFDLDGITFSMKTFYYLILGLFFGLMLFYMLYFIFVKGYFKKLYYQADVNPDKRDDPEFSNATKFAGYFGMYLTMSLLFLFILITLFYMSGNAMMLSCFIYIVIFMMFTILIYNYTMERNKKNIFIIFLVFFFYVILHMLFLL